MAGHDDQFGPQRVRHFSGTVDDGTGDFVQPIGALVAGRSQGSPDHAGFGCHRDAVHHAHSSRRMLANCGLAGEHACVGPVENRVRDVSHFRARGT